MLHLCVFPRLRKSRVELHLRSSPLATSTGLGTGAPCFPLAEPRTLSGRIKKTIWSIFLVGQLSATLSFCLSRPSRAILRTLSAATTRTFLQADPKGEVAQEVLLTLQVFHSRPLCKRFTQEPPKQRTGWLVATQSHRLLAIRGTTITSLVHRWITWCYFFEAFFLRVCSAEFHWHTQLFGVPKQK